MSKNTKPTNLTRRSFIGRTAVASGVLSLGGGLWGASVNPANAQEKTYDYVIIGAGSAGCVLANRLSEEGKSVVIIEAGGPDNSEAISTPLRVLELWQSEYDWAYTTAPQKHANDRTLFWPRGKTLGGSSALNGMIYVRGNASDYDHWANDLGCEGWSFADVLPYFKKSEDFERGADDFHGAGGPLWVQADYEPHPVTRAMVEAAVEAGVPYNDDTNGAAQDGVAYVDLNTKDGKRQSTAVAFLHPALERENLTLITNARVHKVLISDGRATGVSYMQEGEMRSISASAEVIVCGGAIESPRVLMLSGVGPKAHLEDMGIDVLVDSPGVGQNLHDHTLCPVIYEGSVPLPPPGNPGLTPLHAHMFAKTDPALPGADMQPLLVHVPYYAETQEPVTPNAFTFLAAGVRPTSRGQITLNSADPEDAMNIDPNLLAEQYDVDTLVMSIKQMRKIASQPALDDIRGREIYPGPEVQSDDDLETYIRSAVLSYHHQNGTCKMGVDAASVVDPRLKVIGVEGLRVADASVFPFVMGGNTNAPAIMVAEKAADMIKEDNA